MDKYLYCKVMTANPNCLYKELNLDTIEVTRLKKLGIYCMPTENGAYMVGIYQLRALFGR